MLGAIINKYKMFQIVLTTIKTDQQENVSNDSGALFQVEWSSKSLSEDVTKAETKMKKN